MPVHIPVFLNEILEKFSPREGEWYIDCTTGEGGHSLAIAKLVAPHGRVLSIDADPHSLEVFKENVKREGLENVVIPRNGNFANVAEIAKGNDFVRPNGILFDLGFSSWQLEKSGGGFTFQKNEALDMRFDRKDEELQTAGDIVNHAPREYLEHIFREYGEEGRAHQIAEAIIKERRMKEIETTGDLVNVVSTVIPFRGRINPATKVFQALRIAVNRELESIEHGLEGALSIAGKGTVIAVISFHSLEDRIVKQTFKKWATEDRGENLTKKVIKPQYEEVKRNPRSRSAKLRLFKV
ncbi:MAG: 16S rRNA (cytosine(1402)-N(4))-methyltransferase RsmH [Candidatus Spechtbacterales bacterium]